MLMGVFWRQRLSDCVRANPFFFLRRKKNSKRKSCKGDAPLTPSAGRNTTTAWGSSGEDSVQAAQRGQVKVQIIKRPAANIFFGFPSEGKAKSGRAARLVEQTDFAPNTETFFAVYNISVGCRSHPARSPGGLGGRSRIEPWLLISSLSAGANRGSLSGAVP